MSGRRRSERWRVMAGGILNLLGRRRWRCLVLLHRRCLVLLRLLLRVVVVPVVVVVVAVVPGGSEGSGRTIGTGLPAWAVTVAAAVLEIVCCSYGCGHGCSRPCAVHDGREASTGTAPPGRGGAFPEGLKWPGSTRPAQYWRTCLNAL